MATTRKEAPLQDIIAAIRDRVEHRLNQPDDRLESMQSVIYGEKQRLGAMRAPAIWIVAEPYTPELQGGHTVIHRVPYNIVALVKDSDPQRGIKTAERLADGAYDVLMEGRTLDEVVSLVRPGQRDPGYEAGNNQQLQFAAVQVIFEFRRKE